MMKSRCSLWNTCLYPNPLFHPACYGPLWRFFYNNMELCTLNANSGLNIHYSRRKIMCLGWGKDFLTNKVTHPTKDIFFKTRKTMPQSIQDESQSAIILCLKKKRKKKIFHGRFFKGIIIHFTLHRNYTRIVQLHTVGPRFLDLS